MTKDKKPLTGKERSNAMVQEVSRLQSGGVLADTPDGALLNYANADMPGVAVSVSARSDGQVDVSIWDLNGGRRSGVLTERSARRAAATVRALWKALKKAIEKKAAEKKAAEKKAAEKKAAEKKAAEKKARG